MTFRRIRRTVVAGRSTRMLVALALSAFSWGCSSSSKGNGNASGAGGSTFLFDSGAGNGTAQGGTRPYELPADFTAGELGGWKLGEGFNSDTPPNVGGSPGSNADGCGTTILGVVRDFEGKDEPNGHPDFEAFDGTKPTTGMVENTLGTDQKPTYTGICETNQTTKTCPEGQQSTTKANYDEWYRYTADVNKPYLIYFSLEPSNGNLTFQSHLFFPLDGTGWGNTPNQPHNYHFTTEVHTEFRYAGGETFTFIGDDDVWVFINHKLAVDLGGLHPEATGSIALDGQAGTLGITKGNTYPLDLFHAERHTDKSNFRIDTNLQFTNCGIIVPEPPPK